MYVVAGRARPAESGSGSDTESYGSGDDEARPSMRRHCLMGLPHLVLCTTCKMTMPPMLTLCHFGTRDARAQRVPTCCAVRMLRQWLVAHADAMTLLLQCAGPALHASVRSELKLKWAIMKQRGDDGRMRLRSDVCEFLDAWFE
jgi:hypothetical protein